MVEPGWKPGLILEAVPLTTDPHCLPTLLFDSSLCVSTLPERGRKLGAQHGHRGGHLCTPFSVAVSALKWSYVGLFQVCLTDGGVGLTMPFIKPTQKRGLCV